MYQRNLILTIKKPTRVRKNSATAIDHIITGYLLSCDFKRAISKTDLKNHFPIVIALKNDGPSHQHLKTKHYFQSIGLKLKTAMIPLRRINSFITYLT